MNGQTLGGPAEQTGEAHSEGLTDHERKMLALLGDKYHRIRHNVIRYVLWAAILILLASGFEKDRLYYLILLGFVGVVVYYEYIYQMCEDILVKLRKEREG